MGMRVGGTYGMTNQNNIGQWQQRQQSVKDLFSAIKTGDLAAAQKAMSSVSGNNSSTDGPFAEISKALQSGDIQSAQKAAQALHEHHHHGRASTATTSQTAPASSTAPSLTNGTGFYLNTMA